MDTTVNTAAGAAVAAEQINYVALIKAYKVVRSFKRLKPNPTNEALLHAYETWRNEEEYAVEKYIAEMVVIEEMMYTFFFGEEINKKLGFELIPAKEHL